MFRCSNSRICVLPSMKKSRGMSATLFRESPYTVLITALTNPVSVMRRSAIHSNSPTWGAFRKKKVIPIILYALEKTRKPWELVMVGEGEDEASLRELCAKLKLGRRVRFLGWQAEPWEAVKDCRALVMSSIYEGAPLTVIEALACGMQLVSTPVGNVEEVIGDSGCGYIVPFGKPDALAHVLDRMAGIRFTAETARACRQRAQRYLPGPALYDFMCKTDACIRLVLLEQHYEPGKKELYCMPEEVSGEP